MPVSVPAKLTIVIAMLVVVCALGLVGAVQINKAATLHKLNFLHIKHNQAFRQHFIESTDHASDLSQFERDIGLVRAQPIACIEAVGSFEMVLLKALGTSRSVELCISDVALADKTLSAIDNFEQGGLTAMELSEALLAAIDGFRRNSAEFEPLVNETVTFVYRFVLHLLLVCSSVSFLFAIFLLRSVANDYRQIEQTQEELRRFGVIVSSASDLLALVDENYKYLAANTAYLNTFGIVSEDVIGHSMSDMLGAEYFATTIKPLADRCLAGENLRFQHWMRFPGRGRIYLDVAYSSYIGPDGRVCGFVVNVRDITDIEHAKATLVESEERFRAVLDTIGTGVIVSDEKGVIEIVNPATETMFGYTSDEVIGKNVSLLIASPDSTRHDGNLRNYAMTQREGFIGRGRHLEGARKDGKKFPLHLELEEMKIGDATRFVGAISDLTEIQALEGQLRQSQKLEAVGQLTGGIAHDFNNLLAVVQGNLSLLVLEIESASTGASNYMELIQPAITASKRGAELTQRLLAFSRKQTLAPTNVDLVELVNGMEDLFRRTLGETIELVTILNSGDSAALIDPSQLENVLLNLVLNARDAMPRGGRLTIETSILDGKSPARPVGLQDGDYVILQVIDNGCGMSQTVLDMVFDPFFTTKDVGKGSGLGLSMAHGFVQQSGGLIDISSELDEGTSVKLYLPCSDDVATYTQSTALDISVGGDELVLIVEDEANVREMTSRMLRQLGYSVLEAINSETALSILKSDHPIDLLLTDVILPGGMNGPSIAKLALVERPGIKVLFMSGYTEDAISRHSRIDVNPRILQKPFTISDIAARLRETLTA